MKRCIYGVSIIPINKFSQHFDFIITIRRSEVSFLGFRLFIVVTYVYGNFKVKYLPRGAKKVFQILRVDYLMYKLTKKCKLNPEHKNLLKYLHRLEKERCAPQWKQPRREARAPEARRECVLQKPGDTPTTRRGESVPAALMDPSSSSLKEMTAT